MSKICSKCNKNKPTNGSWCNLCRAKREAERRVSLGITPKRKRDPKHLAAGLKECFKCDKVLSINDFSVASRGYAGRMAWCKSCCTEYSKIPKIRKARTQYTKQYRRGKNQERCRVLHRNHQHKRRAAIRSSSDGSVTVDFIIELYKRTICYYCKKYVPKAKRTGDHKIPLIRGGKHSRQNLVMACGSCNFRKKDKTDKEFLKCMKQK